MSINSNWIALILAMLLSVSACASVPDSTIQATERVLVPTGSPTTSSTMTQDTPVPKLSPTADFVTNTPFPLEALHGHPTIIIQNIESLEIINHLDLLANDIDWDPEGDLIGLGTREGVVLLDSNDLMVMVAISSEDRWVDTNIQSIDFHPFDDELVVAGLGFFDQWDIQLQEPIGIRYGLGKPAFSVRYSPSGANLAVGFGDGILIVDDAYQEAPVVLQPETSNPTTNSIAYSISGDRLLSLDDHGVIYSWDIDLAQVDWQIDTNNAAAWDLKLSPDGEWLITGGRWEEFPLIKSSGETITTIKISNPGGISSVAISPDGSLIVLGMWDGSVQTFEVETGLKIWETQIDSQGFADIEFSPDGSVLAIAGIDGIVLFLAIVD